jgi:hypothetical protein
MFCCLRDLTCPREHRSVESMTNFLDGGPEKTARRRFILGPLKASDRSDK